MAKRYGVRLKHRLSNKYTRSNRGRARHAATNGDQRHRCNNERLAPSIRAAFIRTAKRAERHLWRTELAEELFQLELGKSDPEVWLYKTDLHTFKDERPKGIRIKVRDDYYDRDAYYDPYEYVDWDYDLDGGRYRDYDYESQWDYDDDREPTPDEAAWRDLWVDGKVHDPEGRDYEGYQWRNWYEDMYEDEDEYDYWEAYNRLQDELEELKSMDVSIDVAYDRNMERHRAGERYFKTHKRTVFKPLQAA